MRVTPVVAVMVARVAKETLYVALLVPVAPEVLGLVDQTETRVRLELLGALGARLLVYVKLSPEVPLEMPGLVETVAHKEVVAGREILRTMMAVAGCNLLTMEEIPGLVVAVRAEDQPQSLVNPLLFNRVLMAVAVAAEGQVYQIAVVKAVKARTQIL